MAGHSKWANRVHRKTRQDAKRSKIFAKLSRLIIVAAREGGGNPDMNPRLRMAIAQAKAAGMPNDNIEHAIKRGTGEIEGANYESAIYEGYGPGGVALMVEVLTDNKQRTVAEVRNLLRTGGGNMGEAGCVTWNFESKGVIVVSKEAADEEKVFETAIEAGAEDVLDSEDTWEVHTAPQDFATVLEAFQAAGIEPERAEVTMIPKSTTPVSDEDAPKLLRLLERLNEHDDVQQVYSNFEVSDEVLEAMTS